jgi:two-component system response regulator WspF
MRIAIVNDVLLAVEAMRQVVDRTREHQLAWVARDGAEAVELCASDRPDLVLMDLMMPEMDGVEATRRIMAKTPCAIVVVTASVNGASSRVFEAMGAGALDAVRTPGLQTPDNDAGSRALLAKINTIAKLIRHTDPRRPSRHSGLGHACRFHGQRLLAIGASAGGPAALAKVLAGMPATFPAPVIIVQHVDPRFAPELAHWLDEQTPLAVRLARDGDHPQAGLVLLAGTDNHLVFASPTRLSYTRFPLDSAYRPSIDVFFKSIQRHWHGEAVGVLLTGMGQDGAEGLRALRECGCHTIAQDEASSAVYGMPRAAADLKAAREILALDRIGPRILQLLRPQTVLHA